MPFSPAVKQEAKERAHYRCVLCQAAYFFDVHHIVPEAEGGPDTIDNAAPLCPNCHDWFGHDGARRAEVRARRDWWWERCAKIDAAQMTPPDGRRFDRLFEQYKDSQAQEQARLFAEMKTLIAGAFREQAARVSSANTITELIQTSTSSATLDDLGAGFDKPIPRVILPKSSTEPDDQANRR
jgi:HNH endonuclease